MSLKSGEYKTMKVERKAPFGYFLSDGDQDVLLHNTELNGQDVEMGSNITVFLYNDHQGRIAATLKKPKLVLGDIDFLEVKDYKPRMGFFLDNDIDKQVLLPLAELPEEKNIWPEEGSLLLVTFTHDKQDRLLASLVKDEEDIQWYINQKKEDIKEEIPKNQFINGIVLKHLSSGAHIYLENNMVGLLHKDEQLREVKLGESVSVRISYINNEGKLSLSMRPLKEESRLEDADKILEILNSRGGAMPYWDKTPPDIIMEKFHISKAAFKRALGKLLKDGLVYQEDGWTYLKK